MPRKPLVSVDTLGTPTLLDWAPILLLQGSNRRGRIRAALLLLAALMIPTAFGFAGWGAYALHAYGAEYEGRLRWPSAGECAEGLNPGLDSASNTSSMTRRSFPRRLTRS